MGFWNAFTGKAAQWRTVRADAINMANTNLARYIAWLKAVDPKLEQGGIDHLRNNLFAFYTQADTYFAFYASTNNPVVAATEDLNTRYKERVQALNAQGYLNLISVLHASFAVAATSQPALVMAMLEGITHVYNRPSTFAESWLGCLEWLKPESGKRFSVAVGYKAYDEISAILGLEASNAAQMTIWSRIVLTIAQWANDYLNRPDCLVQLQTQLLGSPG
jgi:hypothetical protein